MQIDQIIRSKRKTVTLIVERDGRLIVRAPLRLSLARIQALVAEKSDWILAKQEQARAAPPGPRPKSFAPGEAFWYLGQSYPLEISSRAAVPLRFQGRFYVAQSALPRAHALFTAWYQAQARSILTERVQVYAQRFGFSYQRVRISSARTRWGSCSTLGTLSFTWRLVMAPLNVIDYVVVHELVHLREHNHSKKFWARVQAILPDYQARRDWLKANGHLFTLD